MDNENKYEKLSEKMANYWNTRIIKHNIKGTYQNGIEYNERYYGVHEVYYYKDGRPAMWTENPGLLWTAGLGQPADPLPVCLRGGFKAFQNP